jgi:hypothetical protein
MIYAASAVTAVTATVSNGTNGSGAHESHWIGRGTGVGLINLGKDFLTRPGLRVLNCAAIMICLFQYWNEAQTCVEINTKDDDVEMRDVAVLPRRVLSFQRAQPVHIFKEYI